MAFNGAKSRRILNMVDRVRIFSRYFSMGRVRRSSSDDPPGRQLRPICHTCDYFDTYADYA